MSRLTNDDFRRLVVASATSRTSATPRPKLSPARVSGPKRPVLQSQSKTFEKSGHRDSQAKQAQQRPQYRDRAQERRQAKEEDLAPKNTSSGLDYELLARVRRGEDIYASEQVNLDEDYEAEEDDPELDKQLDEILTSNELEKNDFYSARKATKSKAELLSELRRKIDEKSKSKFKPIGKAKPYSFQEETRAEEHLRTKNNEKKVNKRKEKMSKRRLVSELSPELSSNAHDHYQRKRSPTAKTMDESLQHQPDRRQAELDSPGLPYKVLDEAKNENPADKIAPTSGDEVLDDGDIFEDVGSDYDPFAGLDDDGSSSSSDGDGKEDSRGLNSPKRPQVPSSGRAGMAPRPIISRNYFGDSISPTSEPANNETESASEQSTSMMDIIAEVDLDTVLKNARATKKEISSMTTRGLVPLQPFGGDYDIDNDLGGEGRWVDDDEEDAIGKKSKKRKRA
ncbi:hypothetical protein V1517DRAFT_271463 [Lipomyces orientalis]|uniref:Uncharacterized protein n=1 Tax=Lipomyces orientalis TaxID=1233043 RepID=A0ACC3TUB6_9ASCO